MPLATRALNTLVPTKMRYVLPLRTIEPIFTLLFFPSQAPSLIDSELGGHEPSH